MLQIRALRAEDFPAADDVLRAAFRVSGSFEPRLRRYLALQPDSWLAADDEGQVVGTVGAIDYGAFAYVGLMAVRPDRQGQRVGRKLLDALLAALETRGTACALLDASPSGAPLYERSGFVDAGLSLEFVAEQGDLAAGSPSNDPLPGVEIAPATSGDLDEIVSLDGELLGAARARLWHWLFATHPQRILVARQSGALTGYLCVQDPLLGPFGARAPEVAASLLQEAVRRLGHRNVRLQVPEENTGARPLLEQAGFRVMRSLRHMRRGPCAALPGWRSIYGKGSYCLG
jgi:ribosomal protein S18 acetylase RimI-like enzyme